MAGEASDYEQEQDPPINREETPKVKNIFGVAGRTFLKGLNLSLIDQKLPKDHLELLDTLHEHIRNTEAWIGKELKDNPLIGILITLPGFEKVLSALAALEIDDTNRFGTKAKFASYSALIPSTFASGGKVYHGDLIPGGNRLQLNRTQDSIPHDASPDRTLLIIVRDPANISRNSNIRYLSRTLFII